MNDEDNPSPQHTPWNPHTPVWARQLDQVTPGCCAKLTEITKTDELVRICVSRKLRLLGLDFHVDKLVSNLQISDWLCIISAGLKAWSTMPGSWKLVIFKATEMRVLSAAWACLNLSCLYSRVSFLQGTVRDLDGGPLFLDALFKTSKKLGLLEAWNSPSRLYWLAREPQGSTCLYVGI